MIYDYNYLNYLDRRISFMLYIRGTFHANFPGSRILNFAGNSRAQKPNKAQKKQANITGVQYFCDIWCCLHAHEQEWCQLRLICVYPLFLLLPHNFKYLDHGNGHGRHLIAAAAVIHPPNRRTVAGPDPLSWMGDDYVYCPTVCIGGLRPPQEG